MFFETYKQTKRGVLPASELKVITRPIQPIDAMTFEEAQAAVGDEMVFDVECYINYFLVSFRHVKTGKVIYFEMTTDGRMNLDALHWCMWAYCLVSFNGINYDIPMTFAAIAGKTCEELKYISNEIIKGDEESEKRMNLRELQEKHGFKIPFNINHIDLKEVAPLDGSLKKYAARMHAKRLQDLPYHESWNLTDDQIDHLRDYNLHSDLPNTQLLLEKLREQIKLRESLSAEYGQDVRSKSDAQIAEVVIVSEVRKIIGRYPQKAEVEPGKTFFYQKPDHIQYQSLELQQMLLKVTTSPFVVNPYGRPRCEAMQEIVVNVGGVPYAMGIGGLHSKEASRTIYADEQYGVSDIDVASYYPNLILNAKIRPKGMGDAFGVVYRRIVDRRLEAKAKAAACKKAGDKAGANMWSVIADSLKITSNGTFGKLGSPHSAMYSPEGMIQVTLTGQLDILMLIEYLCSEGFEVISGNTDGICVRYHRSRRDLMLKIVEYWRGITGLETEETEYLSMHQRDVNNYFAFKLDGEVKLKGKYAEKGSTGNTVLSKNPEYLIVSDAVVNLISKKIPLEKTIGECKDIRRFIVVREVAGGAQKDGYYLGKVCRYYYSKNSPGVITYARDGATVSDSDGGMPCMDLPDTLPEDIDLDRYLQIAVKTLSSIGYQNSQNKLF